MARLPSGNFLVQQIGPHVVVFEDMTERTIVRFDATAPNAVAQAQKAIHDSELSDEDKFFAHFWAGYFYAYTSPAERRIQDAADFIREHAETDGAHHKQWVLDQVLRMLTVGSLHLDDAGVAP